MRRDWVGNVDVICGVTVRVSPKPGVDSILIQVRAKPSLPSTRLVSFFVWFVFFVVGFSGLLDLLDGEDGEHAGGAVVVDDAEAA